MRRKRHHWFAASVALLLGSVAAVAAAPEVAPVPEQARIIIAGAAVHSGPGDNFYLTDTLPEDTTVEIYRRTPDGWCAIRPPAESFSWVFAANVRIVEDGLGEITKPDVAARVGSRLSSHRDTVQVRLQKGETVRIISRDERDGDTWYKIAPPSGEFRWVRAQDVTAIDSTGAPIVQVQDNGVTAASHDEPANPAVGAKSVDVVAPPLAPISAATAAPSATAAPLNTAASSTTPASKTPAASSNAAAADITPIPPAAKPPIEDLPQLSELELRLSRMVAEPVATWNVASLEQAAEQLLSRADTVADRDAVKSTLAKIDRFAAIQRRYVNTNTPADGPGSGVVTQNSPPALDPRPSTLSQYDAVGILRPVVSRRPGAPQFALMDDQGQVVSFVTASPDLNLQPYVGRRIGVSGSRGYIPEFHRAHVTAARISPLNDRVLR